MTMIRRDFMVGVAAGLAGLGVTGVASAATKGLYVGVCDWSIGMRGKIEGMKMAAEMGLDSLQISPLKPEKVLSGRPRPRLLTLFMTLSDTDV